MATKVKNASKFAEMHFKAVLESFKRVEYVSSPTDFRLKLVRWLDTGELKLAKMVDQLLDEAKSTWTGIVIPPSYKDEVLIEYRNLSDSLKLAIQE